MSANNSTLSEPVQAVLHQAIEHQIAGRIWNRDASLWKDDEQIKKSIEYRLGWLAAPEEFLEKHEEIASFVEEVRKAGYTSAVLLGMGGSSLCVEVIRDVFGTKEGYLKFEVLDSTHPDQILRIERSVDLTKTLFIVASKSGTTLESDALFNYFWEKLDGEDRDGHFVAITDPGTDMETLAHDLEFRKVFLNPPDIGGRFSVLSYFGVIPAALMGVDVKEFLSRAASEAGLSRLEDDRNIALAFAAFLAEGIERKKDKLTLVLDDELKTFGSWAEQLVAESTGKEGKGILPVVGEPMVPNYALSNDRLFVHLTFGEHAMAEELRKNPDHMELHLSDVYDLGAEFFRWEFATAAVGAMLGINPFDEPNVTEAKAQTAKVLSQYDGGTPLIFPDVKNTVDGIAISGEAAEGSSVSEILDRHITSSKLGGSYIAIMAYVDRSAEMEQLLAQLREKLTLKYHIPVTIGYGPRFLHSTGQLHKGGPDTGIFIQLTDEPKENMLVPTKHYDFATLIRAQAIGDYEALRLKKKPILSFNLGKDPIGTIGRLG